MKQGQLYFFISCLFFLGNSFHPLSAQGNFNIGIIPSFNLPAKISPRTGSIPIQSVWSTGWQWTAGYEYEHKKNAFAVSYMAGRTSMKFDNNIKSESMQFLLPDQQVKFSDFSMIYVSLHFSYLRLISEGLNDKIWVGASVGLRDYVFRRSTNWYDASTADTTYQLAYVRLRARRLAPVVSGEIMEEWTFKRESRFRAGLELEYVPLAPVRGNYTMLRNFSSESTGRFTVDGSFIGVKVDYVFRNRKVKKKNETNDEDYNVEKPKRKPVAFRSFGNNWIFSIQPNRIAPVELTRIYGSVHPVAKWTTGWDANIARRMILFKQVFVVEIQYGRASEKMQVDLNQSVLPSLPNNRNFTSHTYGFSYVMPRIAYDYCLREREKNRLILEAGVGVRYWFFQDSRFVARSYSNSNPNLTLTSPRNYSVVYSESMQNNRRNLVPDFSLAIMEEHAARFGNWQFGLQFQYLPFAAFTGNYGILPGTPDHQYGGFTFSGTSVGFKLGYVFQVKKKVKAEQPQQK